MDIRLLILLFVCFFSQTLSAYVYVDIGQAQVRQSQLAFPPLILESHIPINNEKTEKAGKTIYQIIKDNLSISGYFSLIPQRSFLNLQGEKSLFPYPKDPAGFIWDHWANLETDYLIKASFQILDQVVQMDVILYRVHSKRKMLHKKYKAKLELSERLAHTICNDIIKILTFKKGIFLTKITVVRSTTGSKKELFIMNWNGKNKKQVSFHQSTVLIPNWSEDGNHVAYTAFLYNNKTRNRNPSLLLYNRLNKTRRIISRRTGANLGFDFLPDGQNLLVSLFLGKGYMDIAKMSLKDSSITPLTFGPNGAINVEPVLHPNGKTILFSSDRGGRVMLYTMNINGKNIKPLAYLRSKFNSTPQYSPDGKTIVFSGFQNERFDIFMINSNGTGLRKLTLPLLKANNRWANSEAPSFSPNGQFIVFTSDLTGKYQLYIMNLYNKFISQITNDNHNYKSPKWSPDL